MSMSRIGRLSYSAGMARACLTAALAVIASVVVGCDASTTSVGQRCIPTVNDPPNPVNAVNPNPSGVSISHDFCDDGLSCFNPPDCAEFYCCPTINPTSSGNGYCQPGCQGGALFILISGCNASGWAAPPGWPSTLVNQAPPAGWSPDFCSCFLFGATYGVAIGGPVSNAGICACAGAPDPIACLATTAGDGGTEGGLFPPAEGGSPDAAGPDMASPETGTVEGGATDGGDQ